METESHHSQNSLADSYSDKNAETQQREDGLTYERPSVTAGMKIVSEDFQINSNITNEQNLRRPSTFMTIFTKSTLVADPETIANALESTSVRTEVNTADTVVQEPGNKGVSSDNFKFSRRFVYQGTDSLRQYLTSRSRTKLTIEKKAVEDSNAKSINNEAKKSLRDSGEDLNEMMKHMKSQDQEVSPLATDSDAVPKFDLGELSTIIDNVISNVKESSDSDETQLSEDSKGGLPTSIRIKLLRAMISELGKRFENFKRHNQELVKSNITLKKQRDVAVKTRLQLYDLLMEKKKNIAELEEKVEQLQKSKTVDMTQLRKDILKEEKDFVEQRWVNEEAVIGSAIEELRQRMNRQEDAAPIVEISATKHATLIIPDTPVASTVNGIAISHDESFPVADWVESKIYDHIDAEMLQYAADMKSIQKKYEPPTRIGIGLRYEADNFDLLSSNRSKDIRRGKPTKVAVTNYHPSRLQKLVDNATHHAESLNRMITKQTQDLLEAKSPEGYIKILHRQFNDMTSSLYECVDALAEEHKLVKRWRYQCEITTRRLENIRRLFEKERIESLKKEKERAVYVNAFFGGSRANTSHYTTMVDAGWNMAKTTRTSISTSKNNLSHRVHTIQSAVYSGVELSNDERVEQGVDILDGSIDERSLPPLPSLRSTPYSFNSYQDEYHLPKSHAKPTQKPYTAHQP